VASASIRTGVARIRFIYLLGIEDLARHAGHADILAEQINPIAP
jgi:hypothetical protein